MALPPADIREGETEYPISYWGRTRCTAVSRRHGKRCKAYACHGNNCCRYHGGHHTPKELLIATGATKELADVRYAGRIQNETLREKYLRAAQDPELTDQKDDVALLRAMTEALLERFPHDKEMSPTGMAAISGMLKEVTRTINAITDREAKLDGLIPVSQVAQMCEAIVEIITRHVTDSETIRRIASEMSKLEAGRKRKVPIESRVLPPSPDQPRIDIPFRDAGLKAEMKKIQDQILKLEVEG